MKRVITLIEQLSKGQAGLIFPGYVYPMESGRAQEKQCALYNEKRAIAWKSTIDKIHKNGS